MKEGPLVQMLDRQRVHQAAADEAKKLVDAAALVDATKEAEETATAAAAAAALSPPEEAQVRERVLFIGTQFSILYTSMYSPAEAATSRA
jgi:hypothetical protein